MEELKINGIIYDGVSIKVFRLEEEHKVLVRFTDEITAYSKIKQASIKDKGFYCNGISSMISEKLQKEGVPTQYVRKVSDTEQICEELELIPIEFIVRNVIAGSMSKRLGIKEGTVPSQTIYDLCYKSDSLYDPLINDTQAIGLGLIKEDELVQIYEYLRKINGILNPMFESIGIRLVDYKLEFGKKTDGNIVLADDITPDTARFWDIASGQSLDKDRFRRDSGMVGQAYATVYERLKTIILKD